MELRDKTLYRMKFKVLNGQRMTGQMLSKLASVYVTSINEGAVPNIESAWTYICMTENKKNLDRIIEEFNHNIQGLRAELPIHQEELNNRFNEYF